jgi:hypothetical protein
LNDQEVFPEEQGSLPEQRQNDEQEAQMAEEKNQEATAGGITGINQQINEALQPIIGNLQEQITQTVRQQLEQTDTSVSANGAGALSLDNLGPIGETLQSSLQNVVEHLQPVFLWVVEMLKKLVNWVTGLLSGEGAEQETEGAEAEANA